MIGILFTAAIMLSTPAATSISETGTQIVSDSTETDRNREWSLQRPSRGANGSVVRAAATFPNSIRSFAACVLDRESGGTLDDRNSGEGARNPQSSAAGRWQFLDNSWRRGLSFMVRDRLVEFGMPRSDAREIRQYLGSTHIASWPGWFQDIGFIEVVEQGGRHHWNGGNWSC